MRKIIYLFACACMCACASTPRPVARTTFPIDSLDARPPTDMELTVADSRSRKVDAAPPIEDGEQSLYESSVGRIEKKFQDEYLQLQMCDAVNEKDKKPCVAMLAKFCSINMFLDTRGDHHVKPYCMMVKRQGY